MIRLKYCTVERLPLGVLVVFSDGLSCFTGFGADEIRRDAAEWVGLGDDIPRYTHEHELGHCFVAEKMWDAACPVLWNQAHGVKGNIVASRAVERWIFWWQVYLRIVPTTVIEPEWPVWKAEWLSLLEQEGGP